MYSLQFFFVVAFLERSFSCCFFRASRVIQYLIVTSLAAATWFGFAWMLGDGPFCYLNHWNLAWNLARLQQYLFHHFEIRCEKRLNRHSKCRTRKNANCRIVETTSIAVSWILKTIKLIQFLFLFLFHKKTIVSQARLRCFPKTIGRKTLQSFMAAMAKMVLYFIPSISLLKWQNYLHEIKIFERFVLASQNDRFRAKLLTNWRIGPMTNHNEQLQQTLIKLNT